ncbi:hypothetical protein N337_04985, partial [Phoenicopterus ruber ruber]
FFQLSPCYGSSQELKKKKWQYLLKMVQISDCSRYGPRQQRLAGTFQDAAGGERDLRGDQDLNSF